MAPTQLQQVTAELHKAKDELTVLKRGHGLRSPLSAAPIIGNHILVLFVGPEYHLLTIHTHLLQKATLNLLTTLTQPGCFAHLPNESPELMILYRAYLYTGKIFSQYGEDDVDVPDDGESEAHDDREWIRLANLYWVAAELRDEVFGNKCIDALIEKCTLTDRFPTGMATEIYERLKACEGLSAGSGADEAEKLRKLYVDLHVWGMQGVFTATLRYGLSSTNPFAGSGIHAPHDDAHGPAQLHRDVSRGIEKAGPRIHEQDIKAPWEITSVRCLEYHTHRYTHHCGVEVIDLTEA
ncbi:hypothetical protein HII31_03110 [Pseudocercospora fuligena]|uniref:BTB domain-containing protein n=1 Tax=Pseudocercospora fuligena TaxID=685502 RepID=A0A8H6RSM6_9PEZI|nr:hypothetical protein HII31_03110 [Pseudocercospora fuligena]